MKKLLLTSAIALLGFSSMSHAVTDCALRDEPYSVKTPVIDLLFNPQTKAIVEEAVGENFKRFPPGFIRTETPSFAAIINVENLFAMTGTDMALLPEVDKKISAVAVTEADKEARCARYDSVPPTLDLPKGGTNILIFDKINGFDHGPSVTAANSAVTSLAEQLGWHAVISGNGAVFNQDQLADFDLVVWNNNSGDVLTLSQRKAFEDYINNGGGFLGIHGSGGDSMYTWDFYRDKLIGEQFIGHPGGDLHFQHADIQVEKANNKVGDFLLAGWNMKDEWYSFSSSARNHGVDVVLTLDENSYQPLGYRGEKLAMGDDHPIAWSQCVGDGRSFYTAIGHRPEVYYVPENLYFLKQAMKWAAGQGERSCQK